MLTDIEDIREAKSKTEKDINTVLRRFTNDTGLSISNIELTVVGHSSYADGKRCTYSGVRLEAIL